MYNFKKRETDLWLLSNIPLLFFFFSVNTQQSLFHKAYFHSNFIGEATQHLKKALYLIEKKNEWSLRQCLPPCHHGSLSAADLHKGCRGWWCAEIDLGSSWTTVFWRLRLDLVNLYDAISASSSEVLRLLIRFFFTKSEWPRVLFWLLPWCCCEK